MRFLHNYMINLIASIYPMVAIIDCLTLNPRKASSYTYSLNPRPTYYTYSFNPRPACSTYSYCTDSNSSQASPTILRPHPAEMYNVSQLPWKLQVALTQLNVLLTIHRGDAVYMYKDSTYTWFHEFHLWAKDKRDCPKLHSVLSALSRTMGDKLVGPTHLSLPEVSQAMVYMLYCFYMYSLFWYGVRPKEESLENCEKIRRQVMQRWLKDYSALLDALNIKPAVCQMIESDWDNLNNRSMFHLGLIVFKVDTGMCRLHHIEIQSESKSLLVYYERIIKS